MSSACVGILLVYNIHLFVYSFSKYLLSTCYVLIFEKEQNSLPCDLPYRELNG